MSHDEIKSNSVSSRKSKSRHHSETNVLKTKSVKKNNVCNKESKEQKENDVAMKVRLQFEEGAETESFRSYFGRSKRSHWTEESLSYAEDTEDKGSDREILDLHKNNHNGGTLVTLQSPKSSSADDGEVITVSESSKLDVTKLKEEVKRLQEELQNVSHTVENKELSVSSDSCNVELNKVIEEGVHEELQNAKSGAIDTVSISKRKSVELKKENEIKETRDLESTIAHLVKKGEEMGRQIVELKRELQKKTKFDKKLENVKSKIQSNIEQLERNQRVISREGSGRFDVQHLSKRVAAIQKNQENLRLSQPNPSSFYHQHPGALMENHRPFVYHHIHQHNHFHNSSVLNSSRIIRP